MGSGSKKGGITKHSTLKRVDHEIDRHFTEEAYMEVFEKNLEKLDSIYRKCLANYIEAFALYPDNAKLQDLKLEYAYFFKIFEESSPSTRSLYSAHCSGSNSRSCTEEDNEHKEKGT
ncbi:hypothetical protein ACET3Z_024951 [Daucus carota]